ncbi:DUF2487 family protein [Gracilibacillus oryzae]|nr:DUF2487 family protein [Gracilibacillus oryzae]
MKWEADDLPKYFEAKEYIDTVLVPLIPIQLSNEADSLKLANYQKTLQIIAREAERDFAGRMLLSPVYTYVQAASYQKEQERINQWIQLLFKEDFKHVFFLTFDVKWKKEEKGLDGTLLWLPGTVIENYQSVLTKKWINEQTSQLNELIKSFW